MPKSGILDNIELMSIFGIYTYPHIDNCSLDLLSDQHSHFDGIYLAHILLRQVR